MTFTPFDHECMAMALRLAERGLYTTDPNPRVGCVIARDGQVLGTGWHRMAGGPHAEVVALEDAGDPAEGATAYVTLEPCNHRGRTPPCTDALIQAGVSRVVVAMPDPNPHVNGGGCARLRGAGIRVETGLLAAEAEALNIGFNHRMKTGRPWVRVKCAISMDGRTALANGESQWISGEASRQDVQHWRARSSAVLTGIGTVLADDPSMDARLAVDVVQPVKVIVDTHWRTPPDARIQASGGGVIVAGDGSEPVPAVLAASGAECVPMPVTGGKVDLRALLTFLAEREVNEIQVEAGARLCGSLLGQQLVDEILLYLAPVLLGDGGPGPFAFGPLESMAERTHLSVLETMQVDRDLRIRLRPDYRH